MVLLGKHIKRRKMKTLDEVIKAMEMCTTCPEDDEMCPGCPYADEQGNPECLGQDKEDALHYLKEYKRVQNKIEKIALGNIEDTLNKLDNKPLTWDELKTMEGKPVWIDSVPLVRRWVIIKKFHPIGGNKNLFDMEVEDGAHFLRKNMRRDDPAWWQAYRKERKNETD